MGCYCYVWLEGHVFCYARPRRDFRFIAVWTLHHTSLHWGRVAVVPVCSFGSERRLHFDSFCICMLHCWIFSEEAPFARNYALLQLARATLSRRGDWYQSSKPPHK